MSREDLHFRLRIPDALKKRIEDASNNNRRSMTAEIVARLEDSFIDEMIRNDVSLAEKREAYRKTSKVMELQGRYVEALSGENDALRKAIAANEQIIFQFANAVMKAADGDRSELDALVAREKREPMLKRFTAVMTVDDK